ncbi:MAG: molybdopterin cofactor-binding domain-containing protein, partial [Rubrivivax sp.]
LCHADNAYWLPEVCLHGHLARTNTQSNTAFRGFGGPQGAFAIEMVIDEVARHRGLDALAVRRANFYGCGERQVTPYGQTITDNVIEPLVDELVRTSGYAERRAEVDRFNAGSPVLKKGLAIMPVKFGISFNLPHLNQAGALVHVYTDGSVLVNHGGTEMGQGLNTKVAQVVAHELGLPLARVRASATDTHKVANTSATAASTGSDLNGKAAQDAARRIGRRLASFWLTTLPGGTSGTSSTSGGDEAAKTALAQEVRFADGHLRWREHQAPFDNVVAAAYLARVQLWSDGFYATPGLSWDRQTLKGSPFYYFAYGAAVSEVVIDTLTGETRLLRADLLHDAGRSLNPALDIGQVEGAFVQGLGWLTSEELVWHPETGRLLTHAPS